MATFHLVRHGDKQHADTMVGRMPGVHLTARGRKQATQVARYFRRTRVDLVFASPLERAIETAAPLARAKRLTVTADVAFHEVDTGAWTGLPMAKLNKMPAWKRFCSFPAAGTIPQGETLAEVQARVVSAIARLEETQRDKTIVIFTHEDPIRLAVCHFIGAPINVFERITIPLGSITTLTLEGRHATLQQLGFPP